MTTSPTTGNEGGSRGPTSVVTRANLSTRMLTVWHQRKAQINCLLHNTSPEMRTTHESTCRIPYDIVETILVHAHLARDLGTLKACSLTCRSWYIVALPHLRHTITLRSVRPSFIGGKLGVTSTRDKLKPVSKLHELGQIPLVREIRVEVSGDMPTWFTPRVFNHRDLRYFSAFANIQTLEFRRLRIDYFIPGVERYFEHFSPTLQSIRLYHPCCTPRQLSHFLSLFPNLDNIEILGVSTHRPTSAIPDGDLVPFSVPTLRGWLVLFGNWVNTFADLIAWCGGLRFRCMHLSYVGSCAPVLFEACAETLETVRFSAGVGLSNSFPEPILSPLKVLRSLQVSAWVGYRDRLGSDHAGVVKVFSTITSPVFNEFVIVLDGRYDLPHEAELLETLDRLNVVRPFRLVFLLEVSDPLRDSARQTVTEMLEILTARGLLDFLDSPPVVRIARRFDPPYLD